MAKDSKSGLTLPNPYNEVASKSAEEPDISGAGLYVDYDEVMSVHMKTGSMADTPNTMSGDGIMGGPAAGEVQVAKPGMKPTC